MNILIVDDSPTNLKLLRAQLEAEGQAVSQANDGLDALALLESQAIEVVITDILMPRMDGYRLCHEIRKHDRLRELPVITYTATYTSPGDEKLALDVGADKYLRKPAPVGALMAAIREVMAKPRAARPRGPLMEAEVLKEYNERLVAKLEDKNVELALTVDRYNDLFDNAHDLIQSVTPEGYFLYVNRTWRETLGYDETTVPKLTLSDIIHPDSRTHCLGLFQQVMSGGRIDRIEATLVTKDGRTILVEGSASCKTDEGRVVAARCIFRDITGRRQAEMATLQLAAIVQSSDDAIIGKDLKGIVNSWNHGAEKIFGYTASEMTGTSILRLFPDGRREEEEQILGKIRRGESLEHFETQRQTKGGRLIDVSVTVSPITDAAGRIVGVSKVARDITEHKRMQAQMLRTQRLESIGTLASGVAHDLNNALAPIMITVDLLQEEHPDGPVERFELIQASARRGAAIVKQLLTFAKGLDGECLPIQSQHLFKEVDKMIRITFPKNIKLQTSHAENIRPIMGDATQLHQVLVNLCVNARDAMPNGGTLALKVENIKIAAAPAGVVGEVKPGPYVVWSVTDTGSGIPPEIMDRIFEPFFTTKGPDKGTGLGLSTTLGIVKSHGGFLQVSSTPGQGTTFTVYLPTAKADEGDMSPPAQAEPAFRGNGEMVLVVDDEAPVRKVLRSVLTRMNFTVLTAADGADALLQAAEKQADLRLVITDCHMPNMDGLKFVQALKIRLPAAGVVVVSGKIGEAARVEFKKLGVQALLEKPFTIDKLVAALKTVFQP